jgi:hypothetical protein
VKDDYLQGKRALACSVPFVMNELPVLSEARPFRKFRGETRKENGAANWPPRFLSISSFRRSAAVREPGQLSLVEIAEAVDQRTNL